MAKLTTKARDKLPLTSFGLPGKRAYPMPDKAHARNALARVSQQLHAGHIGDEVAAKVRNKAHRVLRGD